MADDGFPQEADEHEKAKIELYQERILRIRAQLAVLEANFNALTPQLATVEQTARDFMAKLVEKYAKPEAPTAPQGDPL